MADGLGKLKEVDLRQVWLHEAHNFTQWLAKPENLEILSQEIGLQISKAQTEVSVGNFNVDILAEEENTGRKVIVENQLESTNHDHLGKIITYASGLDAEIVIWVVKGVREEHEQAVDWLNEHTNEKTNFFIIKMELWQVDNSSPAPKFKVVSKPNDWAKLVKQSAAGSQISEYKLLQQKFWQGLAEYGSNSKLLRWRKALPQHWYDLSVGKSSAHIGLTLNSFENQIACELYIPEDKKLFEKLLKHRVAIARRIGNKLDWMPLEGRKASRIKTSTTGNIENETEWPKYYHWLLETAERFYTVFNQYMK